MDSGERAFWERALADDDVKAAASRLGFEVCDTPVEGSALRAWGLSEAAVDGFDALSVLAAGDGIRILHLSGPGPWTAVRRCILDVDRAAPQATVLWWWSSPTGWTAAMADADRQGRRRVRKLVVERQAPDEVGLLKFRSLSPERCVDETSLSDAGQWRRHILDVLDQEGVTREFFEGFSEALDELVESMQGGPDDEQLRHDIALGTLLRVVFLYFLQARGALDGDRRFVARQLAAADGEQSFYRGVLRPLFFGALNCPADERGEAARRFGQLPFLNGGLFEPTPVERDHPQIDWPDAVWQGVIEGLLERHRFAVEWSDDNDLCRAVDPEMLGKVFEGLMYGDRRRNSGSFYTPRDVVRSMVRDTLSSWLADDADVQADAVDRLIDGDAQSLSADARRRCRESLANVSVLDPAVGTGAFLLEVLRVLRRVDRALDEACGVVRTPGEHYDRMRRLVHDHLCGVDVQPTAVRLCNLRVWLAMLAALPELPAHQMPPLPNLSHRLCTGNSLIAPLDWVRYKIGGKSQSLERCRPRFEQRSVERLATLQRAYTRAHGDDKRELKRSVDEATADVERHLLESRKNQLQRQLQPYEALGQSSELFGERVQLDDAQRDEKQRLEAEIQAVDDARRDLEEGRRHQAAFSFQAHFAPVMARGGFDMVVTNPPWVRTGRIDRSTRDLYRSKFASSDHQLWPTASDVGIRAPFGAQIDLAALFVERSLELLRRNGRLCALVPVKLFRSLHGAGLRGLLAEHDVECLEDRSEDDRAMFDATTYPSILRVRKTAPVSGSDEPRPVDVRVWQHGGARRFSAPIQNLCVLGDDARQPWMLVPPKIERIFRRMQQASTPLGSVESLPIRGGLKTGCNDAFLLGDDEAKQRFGPAIRERYLRWAIRGRDISPQGVECSRRLIWPVDDSGAIAGSLPAALEAHFENFRQRLEGRSDYRSGPIWTVFRRHDDIDAPGVVWRDLGEQLEAAVAGADAIPMNSVYYLPAPSQPAAKAVVQLFHSEPMRAIARAIAERARGGWRRHFAWVMRLLPIPDRWVSDLDDGALSPVDDPGLLHRAYGLDSTDVQTLAAWRRGDAIDARREVA